MAKKPESYADTSAFIAFADKSDSRHALFKRLFSEPPALLTRTMVVAEGHAWFLKRYNRTRALQSLATIEAMGFLAIIATGQRELDAGIAMHPARRPGPLTRVQDFAGRFVELGRHTATR